MEALWGRIGVVGGNDGLLRRLRRSDRFWRAERCADPVAFARGSATDDQHDRVLAIVLASPLDTDLLGSLRAWESTCPVVGLHHDADATLRLSAMTHGVTSLVIATAQPDRILRAADAVNAGDAMVDSETMQFFTALLPAVDAVAEDLTEDERDWLVWLAAGETMRKMAGKTNWSERQFRRRLKGLYLHLGVANRDQAVALAGRLGVVRTG